MKITRLIQLEFLKLRGNRAMWWLLGLYLLSVIMISFAGGMILDFLTEQGADIRGVSLNVLPIYDFEDIWQNLAYLSYFFKIFPAFLIVISICNEFSFKTHRQNIIDGLSRTEFFLSKTTFAAFLALLSGLLIFILGLILGFSNSTVTSAEHVFAHIAFVPAHVIQLFVFFLMAIFLALLIRKSGITIVLLLLYIFPLELIVVLIVGEYSELGAALFPLESVSNMVHFPFSRYLFMETQNYIAAKDLWIATGWAAIFGFGIYYQLQKRDF